MRAKKEYLPRSYGLSWDTDTATLFFKIEKRLVPRMQELFRGETRLMEFMIKTYPILANFIDFGEVGKSFGFENQFLYDSENEYEIVYRWTLIAAVEQGTEICRTCEGDGKSSWSEDVKCHPCRGMGKEFVQTKDNHFQSGMLTFNVLVQFLSAVLLDESDGILNLSNRRQLVHLETSHESGMHKCWIAGWIADEVIAWMQDVANDAVEPIIDAMFSVGQKLWLHDDDRRSFRFLNYDQDRFWLQVPGNACTLGTEGVMNLYQTGKPLSPHNVDSRTQQMYFIAGFAKLTDEVEQWLITKK